MTKDQFYYGQRVKQKDADDGCWVYGHVTDIKRDSIIIKWHDIDNPCEHFEEEFDSIKEGNPTIN